MSVNSSPVAEGREYIKLRNLSDRQAILVEAAFKWLVEVFEFKKKHNRIALDVLHAKGIEPPRLFITGAPGSGKSYIVETICELASMLELGHVSTAFRNGSIKANVDGTPVCIGPPFVDKHDKSGLLHVSNKKVFMCQNRMIATNLCLVVMDELAIMDMRSMVLLDLAMKQIMASKLPYGGLATTVALDSHQCNQSFAVHADTSI